MSYRLYKAKQTFFENELNEKFRGDMRVYVKFLSKEYPFL
jgi:hypothetical protein